MHNLQTEAAGWETVHQRSKDRGFDRSVRVLLRDMVKHPNDPGWENGRYRSCHDELRNNVSPGEVIIDTVYPKGATQAPPMIRSAFIVGEVDDGEILFNRFAFLTGEIDKAVSCSQPRNFASLNQMEVGSYLRQMEASGAYQVYLIGDRPKSIPEDAWNYMCEQAKPKSDFSSCRSEKSGCTNSEQNSTTTCPPDQDDTDC